MGLFKKPKTPEPTAQEQALSRKQQKSLDDETRRTNEMIKSIRRGTGRRRLLGSFRTVNSGLSTGAGVRGGRGSGSRGAGGGSGGGSGGGIMGVALPSGSGVAR